MLRDEPDLTKIAPQLRKLLRRCLEKDPKKRLRDIGDAAGLIDESPITAPAARSGWIWKIACAALTIALALTSYVVRPRSAELKPLTRCTIELGPETLATGYLTTAVS